MQEIRKNALTFCGVLYHRLKMDLIDEYVLKSFLSYLPLCSFNKCKFRITILNLKLSAVKFLFLLAPITQREVILC